jgi:hypothetical protein
MNPERSKSYPLRRRAVVKELVTRFAAAQLSKSCLQSGVKYW